ncbi:MAG TPA: hypothetical protein VF576_08915 [Rubricoccaceae bacterium]
MRLSLLVFTAAVALTASGCDSSGIDTRTPTTPGGGTGTGGTGTGGTGTGGTGTGTGTGGTGTGGQTPALTFAPVNPMATYLLTDAETVDATAFLLADFNLKPGDTACFETTGAFNSAPGTVASTAVLVTGAFSASDQLSANAERRRIKDVIDGDWYEFTAPMYTTGAATDIDEDFDATHDCWPVPAGATHVFFSVYDDLFLDNSDALLNGQPFGVNVSRQ